MPLKFLPIKSKKDWSGSKWEVVDDNKLSELIARVAVGQSRYVHRILTETSVPTKKAKDTVIDGAVKLLTATDPAKPWHRDGWMFQVISWIAANMQKLGDIIAPPHMIHAHKGFDGIHVKIDASTNLVSLVVICEEKATKNPKKMVSVNVLKEFETMQTGERDNELAAQITQMLESRSDIDVDDALEQIIWKNSRAYRIAVTINDEHNSSTGYEKLFEGYSAVVTGGVEKRRSEVLYLKQLRPWMASLASLAVQHIKKMDK